MSYECYTEDYLKRYRITKEVDGKEVEGIDAEELVNDLTHGLDNNYRVSFVLIVYDHDTKTFGVDYNFRGSDEELYSILGALSAMYKKLLMYLEDW